MPAARLRRLLTALGCLCAGAGLSAPPAAELPHRRATVALPGAPSRLIPADMNGDGRLDLVIALVTTEYEEIAFDRVEGFLQMTEVVPALSERREVRVILAGPDGGYAGEAAVAELPVEVTALDAGPGRPPVVALTGEGVSALLLADPGGPPRLRFEPLLFEPPVLRGARSFLPEMRLVGDLDGDGRGDLLFPAVGGPAIFRATEEGFRSAASARLSLPGDERGRGDVIWRHYPVPRVDDVDGDGHPDLVVGDGGGVGEIHVLRGLGLGRFADPILVDIGVAGAGPSGSGLDLVWFGELDGRGAAEVVVAEELDTKEGDLDEARDPLHRYRFHHLGPGLAPEKEPYHVMEARGHPFDGAWAGRDSAPFRDLDGDGLGDLVTVTLDFSVMQIFRVMATKKFGVGLEFHVHAQRAGGGFEEVEGIDLREKILLDLNDLKLGRLGNFAGDFDGDGRLDFLTIKGGRKIEIHLGRPGCRYPPRPDFTLELLDEPEDPAFVRVIDLDGDGRDDLAVTRLMDPDPAGAATPAALDLYLSRGVR